MKQKFVLYENSHKGEDYSLPQRNKSHKYYHNFFASLLLRSKKHVQVFQIFAQRVSAQKTTYARDILFCINIFTIIFDIILADFTFILVFGTVLQLKWFGLIF